MVREQSGATWCLRTMPDFGRDLLRAGRALVRAPGFAAAAIATLAVGIAVCTVVFSVFDAVALRPLPYGNAARLAMVWDQLPKLGIPRLAPTVANYFDYRAQSRTFEDMAGFRYSELNLIGSAGAQPERIQALAATPNLFAVLGVRPLLGRAFRSKEAVPGRDNVALLSHELWERRFGGDPRIVGRSVRLNDRQYLIAGVMPADARFTIRGGEPPDLWMPLALNRTEEANMRVIGVLKQGTTLARAQAEMSAIASGIQAAYHPYTGPHGEDAGYRVSILPLRKQLFGDFEPAAWVLFAAVQLLLLIACANVANLLVARRLARRHEFAIRAALGARLRHLLSEFAAEAALLAICGGAIGLLAARWAIQALPALTPIAAAAQVRLDWRVALYAAGIIALTAFLFELAGGWWIAARSRAEGLGVRGTARETRRSGRLLVAGEVALTFVLLAGSGLLLESFWRLAHASEGFDPTGVLTMRITLPAYKYAGPRQRAAFLDGVVKRLEGAPGIESAAAVSLLPLSGGGPGGDPFSIEGRPYRFNGRVQQVAAYYIATPGYWRTMRIPLLAGRELEARDGPDSPLAAVVSETLARGFWPRLEDALGKRIMMGAPRPGARWLTIVGIVGDIRNAGPRLTPIPQIYAAEEQAPSGNMVVTARTAGDPMSIATAARLAIGRIDPEQPVYDVRTMDQQVSGSIGRDRFQAVLLMVFALAGLLLAAVGIFGVLERSISARIPEIGVRMALGAQRRDVLLLALREGMSPAIAGMCVGLAAAPGLTRALQSLLFGAPASDAALFGVTLVVLGLVALVACLFPARRAMRVDPAKALRWE